VWALFKRQIKDNVSLFKQGHFYIFSPRAAKSSGPALVLVWVKFHDVPLVAYTLDGLSLITSKIGTAIMLDSYTNTMCLESCGRSSYARALIEINALNEFCDNLVLVVPKLVGEGYTKETIHIKYE
jgi:hypothetical protein